MKYKYHIILLLAAGILIFCNCKAFSQTGSIKGKVIDSESKEPMAFAGILLEINNQHIVEVQSDEDGNYLFQNIPEGSYDLKAQYMGYHYFSKKIKIYKDSIIVLDIPIESLHIELKTVKKPAIYLYPTKTQEIKVKLDFKGKVMTTYPEYNQGWIVKAGPDGKLMNMADKRTYNYLFWDGSYVFPKEHYNYKSGFVVKKNDYVNFLQTKLSLLGLNETEINDFVVYWLPQLNLNEKSLIHFWINDNIDNSTFLDVEPKPDTEIRVFMEFRKAGNNETIPEQILPKLERKGFTAVEWGGADINELEIEY